MRSLAATRGQIFWMLQLPNAMPYIFAGLEIAMIFALIGAIVAEFVGAQSGLGMLMQSMNFTMDVAGQFSVLLILSVLGLLLNSLVNERAPARAVLGSVAEARRQCAAQEGRRFMKRAKGGLLVGLLAAAAATFAGEAAGADARQHRLVRPHGELGGLAVRDRHQDGLVQGRRHQGRARAAARLDRLREAGGDPRRRLRPAVDRAGRDHPAAGRQDQELLHGLPGQHLRHRGAGGQPDQELRRPQGQAHRRHLDGVGRRDRRARARGEPRLESGQGHLDRGGRRGGADRGAAALRPGRGAVAVRHATTR